MGGRRCWSATSTRLVESGIPSEVTTGLQPTLTLRALNRSMDIEASLSVPLRPAARLMMGIATTAELALNFQHTDSAAALNGANMLPRAAVALRTAGSATTGSAASAVCATPASTRAASLADGTHTGATATNQWGPAQITGARWADRVFGRPADGDRPRSGHSSACGCHVVIATSRVPSRVPS